MIPYIYFLALDKDGNPITDENGRPLYRDPRDPTVAISDFEATEKNTLKISENFIVFFKTWTVEDEPRWYLYEACIHDGNGAVTVREKSQDFNKLMAEFVKLVSDPIGRVHELAAQRLLHVPNTQARIVA